MGLRDGLNSERSYVRTLVQSIIRNVAAGELGPAFAICIGLAVTTDAYGRARLAHARLRPMMGWYPAPIDDLAETDGPAVGPLNYRTTEPRQT